MVTLTVKLTDEENELLLKKLEISGETRYSFVKTLVLAELQTQPPVRKPPPPPPRPKFDLKTEIDKLIAEYSALSWAKRPSHPSYNLFLGWLVEEKGLADARMVWDLGLFEEKASGDAGGQTIDFPTVEYPDV